MGTGGFVGMRGTLRERFDRKYIPEPNTGCFLWFGACDDLGYGTIGQPGGKLRLRKGRRLSADERFAIKTASGSNKEIAKRFCIAIRTVSGIRNGWGASK